MTLQDGALTAVSPGKARLLLQWTNRELRRVAVAHNLSYMSAKGEIVDAIVELLGDKAFDLKKEDYPTFLHVDRPVRWTPEEALQAARVLAAAPRVTLPHLAPLMKQHRLHPHAGSSNASRAALLVQNGFTPPAASRDPAMWLYQTDRLPVHDRASTPLSTAHSQVSFPAKHVVPTGFSRWPACPTENHTKAFMTALDYVPLEEWHKAFQLATEYRYHKDKADVRKMTKRVILNHFNSNELSLRMAVVKVGPVACKLADFWSRGAPTRLGSSRRGRAGNGHREYTE